MKQGINNKDIRDFVKCVEKLNEIMNRIRAYKPEAMIYIAEETFNLMSGHPYEDDTIGDQSKIVESVIVDSVDVGDW